MAHAAEESVRIRVGAIELQGDLGIPRDARAVVLFAHGSGSSRLSPRNRYVAGVLREAGLATLLMDLLTVEEEAARAELRFEIGLLAQRLGRAAEWLAEHPQARGLAIGYFGASTGAAAALVAAATQPGPVGAIVSRGGRPDMASAVLDRVKAPTLLIVGGNDLPVIGMNREAFELLDVEKRMEIVPGAGHLFEEPGALEKVAEMARDWFAQHILSVK